MMVVVVMPDVVMVAFVIMSNLIYFMLGAGPIFSFEQISRCKICRDFFLQIRLAQSVETFLLFERDF